MSLLDEARSELSQKTLKEIERDTAWKWAARAVVAYERWVNGWDVAFFVRGEGSTTYASPM